MEFVALIYADEGAWAASPAEERQSVYARYRALSEEGRAAGVIRGGSELQPAETATTVRIREGRTLVTDGPYAEVKEALGGYFLLDCDGWDAALEWASRIPGAETGAVEVRAVHVGEEAGS